MCFDVDEVLAEGFFFSVSWHFDTQQNSNQRSSACSYGFMTLKNTGAWSLIYICAVWSSPRPPGRQCVPARLLYKQAASKTGHKYPLVHLTLTIRPQCLHWGQRRIHGGPVCLSVPDLGMFSCPVLVWDQDTRLLCSCRACWSSEAKLMSFWKQLIKGSRYGRWAISLIGGAGCLLPGLAGGSLDFFHLFRLQVKVSHMRKNAS